MESASCRIDAPKAAEECNSGCRKKGRARDREYRESKADDGKADDRQDMKSVSGDTRPYSHILYQ